MIRWRLYDNNPMRDMLEQMLQAASQSPQRQGRGEPMPINVHQTDSEVFIEAALPGVLPDAIDINCHDGVLTLRAKAEVAEREYFHQEIRGIEYLRQVMLPVECRFEAAQASFEHGLLEIRIPKQQPKTPEKIHIQVNRTAGPTTIDAAKGVGYSEVRVSRPKRAAAAESGPSKKVTGGGATSRKASPGPRPGPSR